MNQILIIGEIENKDLKKSTKELLSVANSIASSLDKSVEICIIGENTSSLQIKGASKFYYCDANSLDMDSHFASISKIVNETNPSIILFSHSNQGKILSAKLAGKLNCSVITDIIGVDIEDGEVFVRKPVYSGKAYVKAKCLSETKIFTIRSNSFELENFEQTPESISIEFQEQNRIKILNKEISNDKKVELTEASIVVSGGRGIKDPKNWPILQELADALGGALGASRSAVDAGWISHSHQVGQTGKTVSPNCYIACGISGAIQHLAGMGSSKYIVAINTDENAPIFKVATYKVVNDLFEIVPEITKEVKNVLG